MEGILIYLLKAHLVASLLFGTYFLLLKNEFFLRLNRFILLAIIFLSIALPVLPMVRINLATDLLQKTSTINPLPGIIGKIEKPVNQKPVIQEKVNQNVSHTGGLSDNKYLKLFVLLYALVVCILLMRFIRQIYQVVRYVQRNERVSENGLRYIDPEEPVAPFSFFHFIVINRNRYKKGEFRQIMAHEKVHADQWHSVDILLIELFNIVLWCNPLVKFFKEAVKLNLEYLADKAVLNTGFDRTTYQRNILRHLMNLQAYTLANSFNSNTKLRIKRMNEEDENTNLYKYSLIIPVIAAIYLMINPLDARALYRLDLQSYAGFYELEGQGGGGPVSVKMIVKNDHLVMKTLWNGKEIWFEKQSESRFINKDALFPLEFSQNYPVTGRTMTAFNKDNWHMVTKKNYKPVSVKEGQQEQWQFVYDQNGGLHTAVYTVNPWDAVKHYKPPG